MKGLILGKLLIEKDQLASLTIMYLVIAIIGIIMNRMTVHISIIYVSLLYTTVPIFAHVTEVNNKWYKLEKLMPLKINTIVLSKYITYIMFLFVGIILSSIYIIATMITGTAFMDTFLITASLLSIGVLTSSATLLYPIAFLFKPDKYNYIFIIICLLVSSAILYLVMEVSVIFLGLGNILELFQYPLFGLIYLFASLGIFCGSYFISVKLYEKKEF